MTTYPVLIADIGGTNSRFAVLEAKGGRPENIRAYENRSYPRIGDAIAAYLADTGLKPARAVLALAGPMREGRVHLTNRPSWSFEPPALAAELAMSRVEVVNDFAALAWALPELSPDDVSPIGSVPLKPLRRPRLVLGPGTGLGVAASVPFASGWQAVPSEAGHVELAAINGLEAQVHGALRARFGRVSAEMVASGTGLCNLDHALAEVEGRPPPGREAAVIADAARAGEPAARVVVDLFAEALARFAGDMALAFVAEGGIFLFGGVAQRLADLIDPERFRAGFEAKAPHGDLLAAIPTSLVTAPHLALRGCAVLAAIAGHE